MGHAGPPGAPGAAGAPGLAGPPGPAGTGAGERTFALLVDRMTLAYDTCYLATHSGPEAYGGYLVELPDLIGVPGLAAPAKVSITVVNNGQGTITVVANNSPQQNFIGQPGKTAVDIQPWHSATFIVQWGSATWGLQYMGGFSLAWLR
jgi:hypothetical protein